MTDLFLPKFEDVFHNVDFNKMQVDGLFWDTRELDDLNKTLIVTTLKLREINIKINEYERQKAKIKLQYNHKYRETLLETEGKTESIKKIMTELACEELEIKLVYLEEMIAELTRVAYSYRAELDTLKTIGHNVRQELKVY